MLQREAKARDPKEVFTEIELQILNQVVKSKSRIKERKEDLQSYIRSVARLGGYLDRAGDSPPGNLVMWRGMSRLNDIHHGMLLAMRNVGNYNVGRTATVEQLAKVPEATATHSGLTSLFRECGVQAQGEHPKWGRIMLALTVRQMQDRCGNNVAAFIQAAMNPVRFVNDDKTRFDDLRNRLNTVLAFARLFLRMYGKLEPAQPARSIDEAKERAGRLRAILQNRQVHADVLAFCKAELLQDN